MQTLHTVPTSPSELALLPAFHSDLNAASLFDALAAQEGRDRAGMIWTAACFAYDEFHAEPDPNLPNPVQRWARDGVSLGMLHFQTGNLDNWTDLAAVAREFGPAGLPAEAFLRSLFPVFADLSTVVLGREYSPVAYFTVPHWTHQKIGHNGRLAAAGGMGDKLSDDERHAIAARLMDAMRAAGCDEWSTEPVFDHPRIPDGIGPEPYRFRAWWD